MAEQTHSARYQSNFLMDDTVLAKVQKWDSRNVHVLCPFCDNIHRHGFDGDYNEPHYRESHCGPDRIRGSSRYKFEFPWEDEHTSTSYEIDKNEFYFVAGYAKLPPPKLSDEEEIALRNGFRSTYTSKGKWTNATEQADPTSRYAVQPIFMAMSELAGGKISAVTRYLDSSADAELFIHGVESWPVITPQTSSHQDDESDASDDLDLPDTKGTTALHLAAKGESSGMVELLLTRGADVDAVDADGRTPLMEASFWGWLENVQLLLRFGANTRAQCIENGTLQRASDFADSNPTYARKRWELRGGSAGRMPPIPEDTCARDEDRREIYRLLTKDDRPVARPQPEWFIFNRDERNPLQLSLITSYSISTKRKTVAVLRRRQGLPDIVAMSGWNHKDLNEIYIDGKSWTANVQKLCKIVGHELPEDDYDGRNPGDYHACHAEKQLIAYFVHKHVFLPHELYDPTGDDLAGSLQNLTLGSFGMLPRYDDVHEEYVTSPEELERQRKCAALYELDTPHPQKQATIMISSRICDDCEEFVQLVNAHFDLHIDLQDNGR